MVASLQILQPKIFLHNIIFFFNQHELVFDNGGKDRIKSFAIVIISDERFDQIVGFLFNNSKIPLRKNETDFGFSLVHV